jgi:hypothetical protein
MLLTITIIISSLILINLLLLKFSCNKTVKTNKVNKKPIVLRPGIVLSRSTQVLAPTGS